MLATLFFLLSITLVFGWLVATRRLAPSPPLSPPPSPPSPPPPISITAATDDAIVRFDPAPVRGTERTDLALHNLEWQLEMEALGDRLSSAGVIAVVFVHGTFAGTDPLSTHRVVEKSIPRLGPILARHLRKKTRKYVERILGEHGNFGASYVRLFEDAITGRAETKQGPRRRIPCTEFVWSSENHHVGRLEGALALLRVLATHVDLSADSSTTTTAAATMTKKRVLVIGHSHAGQLFALVTQLLARSIASEAIVDIARARGLDVTALEADLEMIAGGDVDFVTLGSPARYAWASVPRTRSLHVIAVSGSAGRVVGADWVRRLGVEGSDFPPIAAEDRRINAGLVSTLGPTDFAPTRVASSALRVGMGLPTTGVVVRVDYGDRGLSGVVTSGLGHASYTRLDRMLFHTRLLTNHLYPSDLPNDQRGREGERNSSSQRHG